MEIRQLKAFVTIAEAGTFTAAARRVNITQAAISMQIHQLEEEIGARLFIRAPRRVALTEAGEILLKRARAILREAEAARAELAELTGAESGRLRLGTASAMVSADALPTLLKELRKLHPRAEVTVTSGTSESLIEQMLAGELDLAFVSLPVEATGIETETLTRDEIVAIAHPQHPLAKQKAIAAATLGKEKLILGERGGNARRLIDKFFADENVQPTVTMELSRVSGIVRMAEEGMGVGIVPMGAARSAVAAGKVVAWAIKGAQIHWEMGLARRSGDYESPVRQSFINLCRRHFATTRKSSKQKTRSEIITE
jgi:DNA-binding transcriptional LysR family regulator